MYTIKERYYNLCILERYYIPVYTGGEHSPHDYAYDQCKNQYKSPTGAPPSRHCNLFARRLKAPALNTLLASCHRHSFCQLASDRFIRQDFITLHARHVPRG